MRLRLAFLVPCLAVAACGHPGPLYVSDPERYRGLPSDPASLVRLSDELVAQRPDDVRSVDRALAALERALEKSRGDNFEILWKLARACSLMNEVVTNKEQRISYGTRGREYAERARQLRPDRVEPRYYYVLNQGRVAEAANKLTLLKPLLAEAEQAVKIDAAYDHAGPLRFLGKLYLSAPVWPVSIGDREKAVEVLERAVKLAPVPLNRLFLAEAYFHDDEYEKAREILESVLQLPPEQGLAPRWRSEAESYLKRVRAKS